MTQGSVKVKKGISKGSGVEEDGIHDLCGFKIQA